MRAKTHTESATNKTGGLKKNAIIASQLTVQNKTVQNKKTAPVQVAETKPAPLAPPKKQLKAFQTQAKQIRKDNLAKNSKKLVDFVAKPPKKWRKYSLDLRVHCPTAETYFGDGGFEITSALVKLIKVKAIDFVAVTDYFSVENLPAIQNAAKLSKISIVPGFCLRAKLGICDEIYLVCLFPVATNKEVLEEVLQKIEVPEKFKFNRTKVLETPFKKIVTTIEKSGGIIIPSRIDKTPYRQIAIPTLVEEYGFRTFDLIHPDKLEYFSSRWPDGGFNFLSFSSAHSLGQVGSRLMKISLPKPGFDGLKEVCQRVKK